MSPPELSISKRDISNSFVKKLNDVMDDTGGPLEDSLLGDSSCELDEVFIDESQKRIELDLHKIDEEESESEDEELDKNFTL